MKMLTANRYSQILPSLLRKNIIAYFLKVILLVCFVSLLYQSSVFGQNTRFDFLSLNSQARLGGLSGAASGMDLGLQSLGSNPAFLAEQGSKLDWVGGLAYSGYGNRMAHFVASYKLAALPGPIAFNFLTLHYPSLEALDEEALPTGSSVQPVSFNLGISYGQKLGPLDAGLTLHLPNQYLGDFLESQWSYGLGGDIGLAYPLLPNLQWGIALLSLGHEIRSPLTGSSTYSLPTQLRSGFSYTHPHFKNTRFNGDIHYHYNLGTFAAASIDWKVYSSFSLRTGLKLSFNEIEVFYEEHILRKSVSPIQVAQAQKFSLGASIHPEAFNLDYALEYWHLLGLRHLLSFKLFTW